MAFFLNLYGFGILYYFFLPPISLLVILELFFVGTLKLTACILELLKFNNECFPTFQKVFVSGLTPSVHP